MNPLGRKGWGQGLSMMLLVKHIFWKGHLSWVLKVKKKPSLGWLFVCETCDISYSTHSRWQVLVAGTWERLCRWWKMRFEGRQKPHHLGHRRRLQLILFVYCMKVTWSDSYAQRWLQLLCGKWSGWVNDDCGGWTLDESCKNPGERPTWIGPALEQPAGDRAGSPQGWLVVGYVGPAVAMCGHKTGSLMRCQLFIQPHAEVVVLFSVMGWSKYFWFILMTTRCPTMVIVKIGDLKHASVDE